MRWCRRTRSRRGATAPPGLPTITHTGWATGRGLAVLAQMRADYVVNTERWDSPCLQWRLDLASARSRAVAADAFVAGFSALKRGDRARANRALADLATLNRSRPAPETGYVDPVPGILDKELRAASRQADGSLEDAVALMREATALEDAMPLERRRLPHERDGILK